MARPRRLVPLTLMVAVLCVVSVLVLTGGSTGRQPVPALQIDPHFLLVRETRLGRLVFSLYRARVMNAGPTDARRVRATVIDHPPRIVVLNGRLTFGTVLAGAIVTSHDTFLILRDRRVPFDPADLVWEITGIPVATNSPPVANAGPDQTVAVGQSVTLDGSKSSDANGAALHFHWSFLSRPLGSTAVLSDPTAMQPTFEVDRSGPYEAQLLVNDGVVESAPDSVIISTQNSPPVAQAGLPQTVVVGTLVHLDGSASSDVDGDRLSFHWSLPDIPVGSLAVLSDPTAVQPTFTVDRPGTYRAQLLVNDGLVNSSPAQVAISTQNSPPVANAGPDQTVVVGETVQLDGSQSRDVDGDVLSYQWSFTSTPAGSLAMLSDPSVLHPTFVVDYSGTYTVQLLVNDGVLTSAADIVIISTHNSRPVADAGAAQTVAVGTTVQLDGRQSSDANGDLLSYRWALTRLPPGSAATLAAATAAQPTFVADTLGPYVAQLIVNDGQVDSTPATTTITAATPPQVHLDPAAGALVNTATPLLTITYEDAGSGIDLASVQVTLDGADVTARFVLTPTQATMRTTLADGVHELTVSTSGTWPA